MAATTGNGRKLKPQSATTPRCSAMSWLACRAAAVSLIEQHRIPSAAPGLRRQAAHVMCVTRAFEAVKGEEKRAAGAVGLKEAIGGNLTVIADSEEPALRRWKVCERPASCPGVQRHRMPIAEHAVCRERSHVRQSLDHRRP